MGAVRPDRGESGAQRGARSLARKRPGAAASLREGLDKTITANRLGVTGTLLKTVGSTNPMESTIEIVRGHARRVKRWQDCEMALRWAAAGMTAAQGHTGASEGRERVRALCSCRASAPSRSERRIRGRSCSSGWTQCPVG